MRTFRGPRWEYLAGKGATPQRVLWASTSTKNPAYPDVLYVEELIGPDTVNTMPEETIEAYQDHGRPLMRLEEGLSRRAALIEELEPRVWTTTTSPRHWSARAWRSSLRPSAGSCGVGAEAQRSRCSLRPECLPVCRVACRRRCASGPCVRVNA